MLRAVAAALSFLLIVVCADHVQIRFGSTVGPIVTGPNTYGETSSGLFAVKPGTTTGVKHSGMLKWATNVWVDEDNQMLWAFSVEGQGGKAWNYSGWTEANLLSTSFNPTPLWTISKADCDTFAGVTSWGFVNHMGKPYGWAVDLLPNGDATLTVTDWTGGVRNQVASINAGGTASVAMFHPNNMHVFFDQSAWDLDKVSNLTVANIGTNFALTANKTVSISTMKIGELVYALDETKEGFMIGLLSSAGVMLWNISDSANPMEVANLDTFSSPDPAYDSDYTAGAQWSCYRGNAQSEYVFQNVEDDYSEILSLVNIGGTAMAPTLALTKFNPGGVLWSCAAVGDATAGRYVVATTSTGILYYTPTALTAPAYTVATSCSIFDWAGRIAGVDLYYHGRASTCNCEDPATKPCPLGIEVVGLGATHPNVTAFGPFFLDGVHWLENPYGQFMGALPETTITVELADGPDVGVEGKFACGPIVNTAEIDGNACLVYRGTCTFEDKINHCIDAGAKMVIVVNRPDAGLLYMATTTFTIPIIMISNSAGETLVALEDALAHPSPPLNPTPTDAGAHVGVSVFAVTAAAVFVAMSH